MTTSQESGKGSPESSGGSGGSGTAPDESTTQPGGSDDGSGGDFGPRRRWGLLGGGALFLLLLLLPTPEGLSTEGWRTAAVACLMAVWWMTEAIPIPATALLPLPLFPTLGILEMSESAAPYANELIFLFLGGFLIAFTMERWGLHRRIALGIMTAVGTGPRQLVLGFMVATAFLSMWISNTATAAMMFPIALAAGAMLQPDDGEEQNFGIALMLAIAYGASIGGVATLIGTPPNAILAGAANEILGIQIGFVEWMAVGLPVTIVFLPVAWLLLVGVLYPPGELTGDAGEILKEERKSLGRMTRGERTVGIVFALTALSWLFRAPKDIGAITIPGIQSWLPWVGDATIAMAGGVVLFLLPIDWKKGVFALDWKTALRVPWGVLLLFGGGLSLARAMDESGLAAWIGSGVAALEGVPMFVVLGAAATLFIFLTEVTSNTATSAMAMPIMAGVAAGLSMAPLTLMGVAALSSSMAFMLPVATPPNAIVFGADYMTIPRMAKAGIWMNLISIVLATTAATLLIPYLLVG